MIVRVNSNDGSVFWGCPSFPDCKGVRDMAYAWSETPEQNHRLTPYGPVTRGRRSIAPAVGSSASTAQSWTLAEEVKSEASSVGALTDVEV